MWFWRRKNIAKQESHTGNITINTSTDTLTNIATDVGYIKAKIDTVDEVIKKHEKRITKLENIVFKNEK